MNTCYLRVKFLLFLHDIILFLLFLRTINILISTFCYQQFSTLPFHLFSFTLSTNNSPFSVLPFFYEPCFFSYSPYYSEQSTRLTYFRYNCIVSSSVTVLSRFYLFFLLHLLPQCHDTIGPCLLFLCFLIYHFHLV